MLAYETRLARLRDPEETKPPEKHRKSLLALVTESAGWVHYTESDLVETCDKHPEIQRR